MNISYVTTGHENIASFRYRILSPAMNLGKHLIFPSISNKCNEDAAIAVFSKHWTYNDYSYAQFCKFRGQKIVFDVCDDHFETMESHYKRMCELADVVTVNSHEMYRVVEKHTGIKSVVIPDPVLSPRQPYKGGKATLLWYGQKMNIQGLYDVYTEDMNTPMEVIVPARLTPPEYFNAPWITWSQWHKDIIEHAAKRCTIAVLPYRQEGKTAKSANRVLEALWSGLPVCTDMIPAVKEITSDCIFDLGKGTLKEGVDFFTQRDMSEEMALVQKFIEWKYSPEAITKQWAEVFKQCV